MTDLLARVRRLFDRDPSPSDWIWITGILVPTLVLAILLEPLWFLTVLTEDLPWLLSSVLRATGVSATTALAIWAGALAPVTVFVVIVVRRWLEDHGHEHPEIRQRIRLRAIVTGAFALGFFAARAFVVAGQLPMLGGGTVDDVLPINEIWVQGHHIHHFFLGFTLVAVAGWIALFHDGLDRRWTAGLYGIGLGVFLDEIGLLLTWGDYWARSSWLVVAAVLTLFLAATLWSWYKATHDLDWEPTPADREPQPDA